MKFDSAQYFIRRLALGRHCWAGSVDGAGPCSPGDWQVGSVSNISTAHKVPGDTAGASAKREKSRGAGE